MADLELPVKDCVACFLEEKNFTMTEDEKQQFADKVIKSIETEMVFSLRSAEHMLEGIENEYAHQLDQAKSDHGKVKEEDAAMAKIEETLEEEVANLALCLHSVILSRKTAIDQFAHGLKPASGTSLCAWCINSGAKHKDI